jgi:hypothetical protein
LSAALRRWRGEACRRASDGLAVDGIDHGAGGNLGPRHRGGAARPDAGDQHARLGVEVATTTHRRRQFGGRHAVGAQRHLAAALTILFLGLQLDVALLAAALHAQGYGRVDRQFGDRLLHRRHVDRLQRRDWFAVEAGHAITGLQARLLRRRAALDGVDQHAFGIRRALQGTQPETERNARHFALVDQRAHDAAGLGAGNCKGQVAADDHAASVHADDATRQVYQRATGISRAIEASCWIQA